METGITTLGTVGMDDMVASLREPRSKDVTLKAAQGVLSRGTLVELSAVVGDDNLYIIATDATKVEGVIWETVDTGGVAATDDVPFYVAFDLDLFLSALTSSIDGLGEGYLPKCGINIKGGN